MKTRNMFIVMALLIMPTSTLAVSTNSQGQGSTNSQAINSNSTGSSNQNSNTQVQTETQTRTQTNNPETGTMTQTEEQTRMEAEVKEKEPKYSPTNSKAAEHRNAVADVVQQLIGLAYQIENTGLGDQIKLVAQTQSQNQDRIGQAVDNADKRSALAKFFIGSNYKELAIAKTAVQENRTQLQELEKIMLQIDNDTEKLEIAKQIVVLQNTQLELKDQIDELASGFSLFGWINRWKNNY